MRRIHASPRRARWTATCVLVAFAMASRAVSQVSSRKAGTRMNAVIATFPTEPAVLSGQALTVRTIFDNRGGEAIAAPMRAAPSQFTYRLRSQQAGGVEYNLSLEATIRRRSPERPVLPRPQTEMLAAGAQHERFEEIADYWNEGFAPGDYWLTVEYPAASLQSSSSAVTVLPVAAESFSSFVSVDHLSSVLAHRRPTGEIVLLDRESRIRDPREGVFRLRHSLEPGAPVTVATSIDIAPVGNGRWLAWLRGGKLEAMHTWGDKVLQTTTPLDAAGALLSPGFQIAVGTARFATVSSEGRLHTFVASGNGLEKSWTAELGSPAADARWNAQADGSVTVAWQDPSTGRVLRRAFTADGKPRDAAPQTVVPARPLAWGFAPSGAPVIWAVANDGNTPVIGRLPLGGERALTRLPELAGITAWDYLDRPSGAAIAVIAHDKIYGTPAAGAAWKLVADAPRASHFHVVSLDGRSVYAEWIEAGFGVRRARLP